MIDGLGRTPSQVPDSRASLNSDVHFWSWHHLSFHRGFESLSRISSVKPVALPSLTRSVQRKCQDAQ
eukprot:768320-Hanusia_phi.AAC.4